VAAVREVDAVKQGEVLGKQMKLLGATQVQAQLTNFASCRRRFHGRPSSLILQVKRMRYVCVNVVVKCMM
jgi:hypothetical protein